MVATQLHRLVCSDKQSHANAKTTSARGQEQQSSQLCDGVCFTPKTSRIPMPPRRSASGQLPVMLAVLSFKRDDQRFYTLRTFEWYRGL